MATPTNHDIARDGFTLRRAPGPSGIFATSSCQIQVRSKKKSYHLSAGFMGNSAFLLHYVRTKVRSGPEIATFRIKTLNFTLVIHWLAKIELRGPGTPGSLLLLITVVRVCCCTRRC